MLFGFVALFVLLLKYIFSSTPPAKITLSVPSVLYMHVISSFFLHVVAQFISVSVSLLFRMLKQLPSSAVIDLRVPFRTELSVTSFQSPPYELASPDLEMDEGYPDGETAGVQNASPTSCPT